MADLYRHYIDRHEIYFYSSLENAKLSKMKKLEMMECTDIKFVDITDGFRIEYVQDGEPVSDDIFFDILEIDELL